MSKRNTIEDSRCLFCNEREYVAHLLFDCVMANQMWVIISEVLELNCGRDFESIGKLWLSKRYTIANMFTSAALWGLWPSSQLETALSGEEETRFRAKARQNCHYH